MSPKCTWLLLVVLLANGGTIAQAQPRGLDLSPIERPLYALRAHRELGLTMAEVKACETEFGDYKRAEKHACFRAWIEVKDFPKTEIKLAMEKWIERRRQTRKEQIQLIRDRIKPKLRGRYNEILFQCCLYQGDFFLAAEVAGLKLDDEAAENLQGRSRSREYRTLYRREMEAYRQMVDAEMMQKELGQRIDLGTPSTAAREVADGASVVDAMMMYSHHVAYGQLLHKAVVKELAMTQDQQRRVRAIGQKYGIKERNPEDGGTGSRFGLLGGQDFNIEAGAARSEKIVKEMLSVLSEGQRIRFRQVQIQALLSCGYRDQALSLLGIDMANDHNRNVRIDRVKNAIAADYQLIKAREVFGTFFSFEEIDRAMGLPSFEFLDSQAIGFGGAMSSKRDDSIVPRRGPAFEKLARQAGPWYAKAMHE